MQQLTIDLIDKARKMPIGDSWTYRSGYEYVKALIDLVVRECAKVARAHFLDEAARKIHDL